MPKPYSRDLRETGDQSLPPQVTALWSDRRLSVHRNLTTDRDMSVGRAHLARFTTVGCVRCPSRNRTADRCSQALTTQSSSSDNSITAFYRMHFKFRPPVPKLPPWS